MAFADEMRPLNTDFRVIPGHVESVSGNEVPAVRFLRINNFGDVFKLLISGKKYFTNFNVKT